MERPHLKPSDEEKLNGQVRRALSATVASTSPGTGLENVLIVKDALGKDRLVEVVDWVPADGPPEGPTDPVSGGRNE